MDAISRSMAAAPPGQTVDEWARTTPEGRMVMVMRKLTVPQREAWLQCLRNIVEGMPIETAALRLYGECGVDAVEAAERVRQVLGGAT